MGFYTNIVIQHLLIYWGIGLYYCGKLDPYVILVNVLNQLLSTPILLLYGDFPEQSMTFIEMFRVYLLTLLYEEILFYCSHYLLHSRILYQWIHYFHHSWTEPIPLATFYAHPLEHIFGNVLPIFLSAQLAGMNETLFYIWHFHVMMNTVFVAHRRPDSPHYQHHQKRNCNYGVTGLLDQLLGTTS